MSGKSLGRESGYIGMTALIFMSILMILAPILYSNSINSYIWQQEQLLKIEALHLATTGIISAEKIVVQEDSWRGINFVQKIGARNSTVQIMVSGNSDDIQWFSSTVVFPDYKIQLVRSKAHLIGGRAHEVYQYDLYAKNNLTIATGVTADKVSIASRVLAMNQSPLVVVKDNVDIVLPTFNRSDYNIYSTYLPLWDSLDQGFDGRVMGKMYDSNFTLGEYSTLLGSGVIINSNINIRKNSNVVGAWHLISTKDIIIDDNCKLNNVLLFARGDVIINKNVLFTGRIIAGGNIKIGDNCKIKVATEELSIITSSIYSS